jgi:serine/threonine protein kinase
MKMEIYHRREKYHTLRELLKYITTNVYDVCVKGATDFNKKLDEINEIGRGSLGRVYLASINEQKFVVKETKVQKYEWERIKNNKIYNEILPSNSYVEEYRIMEFLSEHVVNGGFPNFLLSYKAAVCETCSDTYGYYSNSCFMAFMEPAMCNFREFMETSDGIAMFSNINALYSIIYQLLLGMCVLHFKYGISHRDLHYLNILVLKVEPGGYFRYVMDGKEYFVENHGYLFCLHDFGTSRILNPDYSSGDFYGTRDVLVNQDGKLEPINFPFTIDINDNITRTKVINWSDGRVGTDNEFTIKSRSILDPDNLVDLTDMKKFPPIEFSYDLQDLLNIFVVFSRDTILTAPKQIKKKLKKIIMNYVYNFKYDKDSAIFLRADMMLDYLYEKPIGLTKYDIIQSFFYE